MSCTYNTMAQVQKPATLGTYLDTLTYLDIQKAVFMSMY